MPQVRSHFRVGDPEQRALGPEYYNDPGRLIDVFNREFNIGTTFGNQPDRVYEPNKDFDPVALTIGSPLEDYIDILGKARNASEYDHMVKRIRQESHDMDILGNTSFGKSLLLGGAVSLIDPINVLLMPFAIPRTASLAALMGRHALLNAGAVAGQEAFLQNDRLTRTAGESVANVLGGAVIGGGLAGVIQVGSRTLFRGVVGDGGTRAPLLLPPPQKRLPPPPDPNSAFDDPSFVRAHETMERREAEGLSRSDQEILADEAFEIGDTLRALDKRERELLQAMRGHMNEARMARASGDRDAFVEAVQHGDLTKQMLDQVQFEYEEAYRAMRGVSRPTELEISASIDDEMVRGGRSEANTMVWEADIVLDFFDAAGVTSRTHGTGGVLDNVGAAEFNNLVDDLLDNSGISRTGAMAPIYDAIEQLRGRGSDPDAVSRLKDVFDEHGPGGDPFGDVTEMLGPLTDVMSVRDVPTVHAAIGGLSRIMDTHLDVEGGFTPRGLEVLDHLISMVSRDEDITPAGRKFITEKLEQIRKDGEGPGGGVGAQEFIDANRPDAKYPWERIDPPSGPQGPEQFIDTKITADASGQSRLDIMNMIDDIPDDAISPTAKSLWKKVMMALPEHIVEGMHLKVNRMGPDASFAGFYEYFTDIVTVFTRKDHATGLDSRNLKSSADVSQVFSHEVGHRVLMTFMNEEELLQAWQAFKRARNEFAGEEPKDLSEFNYRESEDFHEWFANAFSEYIQRNIDGTARRSHFQESFIKGDEGQIMRLVKRVAETVSVFAQKLSRVNKPETYDDMIDNFMSNLMESIGPDRVARSGEERVAVSKTANRMHDPNSDAKKVKNDIRRSFDDMAGRRQAETDFNDRTGSGSRVASEGGDGVPPRVGAGAKGGAASSDGSRIHPTGTGVEDLISPTAPVLRLLASPSRVVREVTAMLLETPFWLKKNWNGVRTEAPVEALAKLWRAALVDSLKEVTNGYTAYHRKFTGRKTETDARILAGQAIRSTADIISGKGPDPKKPMSLRDFREAVSSASRRGDVSDIPEVSAVAAKVRETRDQMMEEAKAVGLVGEDLDAFPSQSHLPRMWQQDIVREKADELVDRIVTWQHENKNVLPPDLRAMIGDRKHRFTIKAQVDQISGLNNGLETLERHQSGAGPKGAFKERTVFMPDDLIEDFLENDIDTVMRQWVQIVAVDIELAKKFKTVDMKDYLKAIDQQYLEQIAGAPPGQARIDLNKRREADIRDIVAMRDILRGVYNIPDFPYAPTSVGARLALEFNNLTMLGGVTLSSLPDTFRIVMRNGMATLPVARLAVTDFQKFKILARESKLAGTALDMILQTRALALAHTGDLPNRFTGLEKKVGYLSNAWFIGNMLSPWNAAIKQAAGAATGHRMAADMKKLGRGTLGRNKVTQLASVGIDMTNVEALLAQIKEHGEVVQGVHLVNSHLWGETPEGLAAQRVWRAAMVQEVDAQIVTPGAGDLPLFARRTPGTEGFSKLVDDKLGPDSKAGENIKAMYPELGKVFFQYKSFVFGSATRVAVSGLQAKDAATLHGLMGMIMMGGMVVTLKDIGNGRRPPDGVDEFLFEGFDQSGAWGWAGNVNTALEALSDNNIGMRPLLGMADPWGSSDRWKVGSVLGPTAGSVMRAGEIASDVVTGSTDWRTAKSAYRFIPGNNWFPLKLYNASSVRQSFDQFAAHEEGNLRP